MNEYFYPYSVSKCHIKSRWCEDNMLWSAKINKPQIMSHKISYTELGHKIKSPLLCLLGNLSYISRTQKVFRDSMYLLDELDFEEQHSLNPSSLQQRVSPSVERRLRADVESLSVRGGRAERWERRQGGEGVWGLRWWRRWRWREAGGEGPAGAGQDPWSGDSGSRWGNGERRRVAAGRVAGCSAQKRQVWRSKDKTGEKHYL